MGGAWRHGGERDFVWGFSPWSLRAEADYPSGGGEGQDHVGRGEHMVSDRVLGEEEGETIRHMRQEVRDA